MALCPAGHQYKDKNHQQERLRRVGGKARWWERSWRLTAGLAAKQGAGGRGGGARGGRQQGGTSSPEGKGVQHPDCPAGAPLAGRRCGQGPDCEQGVV